MSPDGTLKPDSLTCRSYLVLLLTAAKELSHIDSIYTSNATGHIHKYSKTMKRVLVTTVAVEKE
jgi:hypothetical protein